MIELPEAVVIAQQMDQTLKGKDIIAAQRGQSPHKFAFVGKHSDEEFKKIVTGKRIGKSWANGYFIFTEIKPGYLLSLGCGGEKIIYHEDEKTLPKKHQILLEFKDHNFLTVTVSGWGETRLIKRDELEKHPHLDLHRLYPLSTDFTYKAFKALVKNLPEGKKCSAKKFFVSEPGLRGIGNGVIQDIFYYAGVHPKQEMSELSDSQIKKLYNVTRRELQKMIDKGGRDGERDLFGEFGGYQRALLSKTAGTPCRVCKTKIVKESYMGGAIYYCPKCQELK